MSVPQRRRNAAFALARDDPVELRKQLPSIGSDQDIASLLNRYRSLGILAHGETRDGECGRFFLDPARIRDHGLRRYHQTQEIEVAERLGADQARRGK